VIQNPVEPTGNPRATANAIRRLFQETPVWSIAMPVLATLLLVGIWTRPLGAILFGVVVSVLIGAVIAAVHHAEVIALRTGEPFGTLVLALAVTIIEVSLIVALMMSGDSTTNALARDTVFATVMIICNGVVGLCLLLGAMRHRVLAFRVDGTSPALSVLATLAILTLVLPTFTVSTPGPTLTPTQLAFAGVVSLTLYLIFVFVQTVRHRDLFIPLDFESDESGAVMPARLTVAVALGVLLLSLVAVVGLAKVLAPGIETVVEATATPRAAVGIVIALIVLLPETWAALRAAMRNRMQTSFNLALGSALATIGLTIPAVAATSLMLDLPLTLGLPPKEIALLALTLLISSVTLGRGLATVLQGAVHLVLFAVFLFLTVKP
jgi:Ca2+:H+ antiporter